MGLTTQTSTQPCDHEVDARALRLMATLSAEDDDRARLAHLRSGAWCRPDIGWEEGALALAGIAVLVNGVDPGAAHRQRVREANTQRQRLCAFEDVEGTQERMEARREHVRVLHGKGRTSAIIASLLDVTVDTVRADIAALELELGASPCEPAVPLAPAQQAEQARAAVRRAAAQEAHRTRPERLAAQDERRRRVEALRRQGWGQERIAQDVGATRQVVRADLRALSLA